MKRLFGCSVNVDLQRRARRSRRQLTDRSNAPNSGGTSASPMSPHCGKARSRLGEDLFNEIISHPVPIDMNTLKSLKRSSLGLDLYLWLVYRTFSLHNLLCLPWSLLYRQFGVDPDKRQRQRDGSEIPQGLSARVEEDQAGLAGVAILDGSRRPDPASLDSQDCAAQSRSARKLDFPFPALSGLSASGWTSGIPPRP